MRAFGSLCRQAEFSRLYRQGRRFSQPMLQLYIREYARGTYPRVGISVSKAVGNAVKRNLVRRRLQGVLDHYGLGRFPKMELLIVAKAGSAEVSYSELERQLTAALMSTGAAS